MTKLRDAKPTLTYILWTYTRFYGQWHKRHVLLPKQKVRQKVLQSPRHQSQTTKSSLKLKMRRSAPSKRRSMSNCRRATGFWGKKRRHCAVNLTKYWQIPYYCIIKSGEWNRLVLLWRITWFWWWIWWWECHKKQCWVSINDDNKITTTQLPLLSC